MSTAERLNTSLWVQSALSFLLIAAGALLWGSYLGGAESARAWRALLVNFLFFTSLAGGLVTWPALVRSANGTWHLDIERLAFAGMGFALPSLVAMGALWIGSPRWTPWFKGSFHQGVWLDNGFLFGRNLLALLLFWLVAARYLTLLRKGEGRATGGILIAVYAFVFSLIGMDLVMALDPHWYSTLAGAYFFMSGLYIAVTFWALLAATQREPREAQLLDLGRLMVAFSLLASYLMYSHLLPIWYEVLPQEVRFVVPRMNFDPWKTVSLVLIALVYLGPLVLLIMERGKRNRWYLGAVSVLILAGMWLERLWLVAPTFDRDVPFGVIEISALALLLGFLWLGMAWSRVFLPQLPPRRENEPHGE